MNCEVNGYRVEPDKYEMRIPSGMFGWLDSRTEVSLSIVSTPGGACQFAVGTVFNDTLATLAGKLFYTKKGESPVWKAVFKELEKHQTVGTRLTFFRNSLYRDGYMYKTDIMRDARLVYAQRSDLGQNMPVYLVAAMYHKSYSYDALSQISQMSTGTQKSLVRKGS